MRAQRRDWSRIWIRSPTKAKEEFERGYLKEVLQSTRGNISRASLIGGRYRADFYELLKKYGLDPSDAKVAKKDDMEGELEGSSDAARQEGKL